MKNFLLIISFLIASTAAFAQRDSVDAWMSKIDNSQLKGTCHYVWTLELEKNATEASKLIAYGKPASEKLAKELTNGRRNVIAHFILASIWGPLDISTTSFDEAKITYVVTGLQFTATNDRFRVSEEEIAKIRSYWTHRIRSGK